jgi:low temperature requirement protein LtrA
MDESDRSLRRELRDELRHRLRPMRGRDPRQRDRSSSPLELLYDLTYVLAFSAAAEQLAVHLAEGRAGAAVGAYLFAIFSVSWAWLNFTWFTSAYGNDDVLLRVATIVQMAGVVVLTLGLRTSFAAAADGGSPNNALLIAGYVVMRVPLVALWLRAARQDAQHRATAVGYAAVIAAAQLGWITTAVLPLPTAIEAALLVGLAVTEMVAPVVLERRVGRAPWNAAHMAERFGLVTLITLGEVIAATTAAVAALTEVQGWTVAAVVIAASGLVLSAGFWWTYFLVPSRTVLPLRPGRTFAWRYVHLPLFGAIAAVGAGLRVVAIAVERGGLTALQIALIAGVPVAAVIVIVFATWSVLMHSADRSHVPLFLLALLPVGASFVVAASAGPAPLDLEDGRQQAVLVAVVGLIALAPVVEVVGHEIVGYRHTVRVLEQQGMLPSGGHPGGPATSDRVGGPESMER